MRKCLKIYIEEKLKTKNDDVTADVAQRERSNIKCYATAFRLVVCQRFYKKT